VGAPELLKRFVLPLEALGARYMVTGSLAAMAYGEPRLTNDVDVVLELAPRDAARFVRIFEAESDLYVPPAEVIAEALEGRGGAGAGFNVIDPARALKADYFPALDELARWGLDHRRREPVEGAAVWVAPPEYVIARKLQYFRAGGSAKHLDDIRSILRFSADRLELAVLEGHVERLGLDAEWALCRQGRSER
jgi:hypothetical protein